MTFKNHEAEIKYFEFNFKLFNISGAKPSENINSSLWKSALYRIFQTLSMLLVMSMITLQILAIYIHWGNINLMVDCIGFIVVFAVKECNYFHTIINWQNICDVTDNFETNSIFCSEWVRSNPKHMKILNANLKLAQIFKMLISISMCIVPIFFILPTFVQHLMTSDEEILQEAETIDGFTKYFIFVMWFPPVVKQETFIRLMYVLQCIYLWDLCLFIAAIASFYAVLFLCTGAQFKLISSIITEMDEVTFRVENPGNTLHEVPKQLFTNYTKKLSNSFQSPMSNNGPLKSNLDIEGPAALSTEIILRSEIQQNILQEVDINGQSEAIHDLSSTEIKLTTKSDPETFYLVECIKLHQASIK